VAADDLGRRGVAVVERHLELVGVLDDVVVRDDAALVVPDEARAGPLEAEVELLLLDPGALALLPRGVVVAVRRQAELLEQVLEVLRGHPLRVEGERLAAPAAPAAEEAAGL